MNNSSGGKCASAFCVFATTAATLFWHPASGRLSAHIHSQAADALPGVKWDSLSHHPAVRNTLSLKERFLPNWSQGKQKTKGIDERWRQNFVQEDKWNFVFWIPMRPFHNVVAPWRGGISFSCSPGSKELSLSPHFVNNLPNSWPSWHNGRYRLAAASANQLHFRAYFPAK